MIEMFEPGQAERKVDVLDHGYVILRNMAGPTRRVEYTSRELGNGLFEASHRAFDADDTDVANAARMSFGASDKDRTYEMEMKLTKYLLVNHHSTPFEMIQIWLEYKLPIFCARQFHRHRTQGISEISGRYVTLPSEWYIPEVVGAASADKKQGQVAGLEPLIQKAFREDLQAQCAESYRLYLAHLGNGVAAEHARLFLHTNHYTRYLSTANLRNLLGFLLLRDHGHAQLEAQAYAKAIIQLLVPHIPGIMGLWENFRADKS